MPCIAGFLMSADEESLEDHVLPGASPSLEVFGGEGAASEQEASGSLGPFQMAVWSLLHDAPSEPQIEDEPQDFLQESILDEEQERAWYSQAEDTEVKNHRLHGMRFLRKRWNSLIHLSQEGPGFCLPLRRLSLLSWRLAPSGGGQRLQTESRIGGGVFRPLSFLGKLECGVRSLARGSSRDRGYSSLLPSIGVEDVRAPEEVTQALEPSEIPSVIRRRLRTFRLERPEDDRRDLALRKLRQIILFDPSTSELGEDGGSRGASLG